MKLIFKIFKLPDNTVSIFEQYSSDKFPVVNIPEMHLKYKLHKFSSSLQEFHYQIRYISSLKGLNVECGWTPYLLRKL